MPLGLAKVHATFQRLVDRDVTPEIRPNVFSCIDNIVIATKTFNEYCLGKVLNMMAVAGMTINPNKSEFCCSYVKYLGSVVNKDGLKVKPEKVDPIVFYLAPKTVKHL